MKRCHPHGLIFPALLLFSGNLFATNDVHWTYGAGLAALTLDDYRGSHNRSSYLLPFPYLRLESRRLAIDEDGIHGRLATLPNARLEISLAAGTPVAADKNPLRQGMPDLDPSFEIGPALEFTFARTPDGKRDVVLNLPLRAVFTVSDFNIQHQGWISSPYLEYRRRFASPRPWHLGIAAGPVYADRRYHSYFYSVAPQYVLADRPVYQATSGYSGYRLTLTLTKRIGRYWLGAFVRRDVLSGAMFTDSPLVDSSRYLAAGIALAWIIGESGHGLIDRR